MILNWVYDYELKNHVEIENTLLQSSEEFINKGLVRKYSYTGLSNISGTKKSLKSFLILSLPSTFNIDFETNLEDIYYTTFYKNEAIFFLVILAFIVQSLLWRLKYTYRLLNFLLNIYVILILILLFITIFFTGDMFVGAKVLFNSGLLINYFTSYAKLFVIGFTIIFLLISLKFFFSEKNRDKDFVDYPLLIALSVFFIFILVSSFDLMVMYVAIEGLSILLYILAMFPFKQSSIEASIKYYSLGALSSGILLFGISLMYGLTGALDFLSIKAFFLFESWIAHLMFYLMVLSFIFGFLFKISAFPCHMWAPDVYEGTWLPTTIFFMTVVKLSLFFIFTRFLVYFFFYTPFLYQNILLISAVGSLLVGSIGSLYQRGLKRLLAYASISQVGFALFGLWCHSIEGIVSSLVFFTLYIIVSLAIFTILINVESFYKGDNLVYISDLSNFSKYNVLASIFLSIFLLSMAGIPPLSGFFSKVFIFISTTGLFYYSFTISIIFLSTINAFVYFKLIKILWSDILSFSENKEVLLYDIFIMNLPKKWSVNEHKSYLYNLYEGFLTVLLYFFVIFVSFFVFIMPEYLAFCTQLSISLIDIWY
jgi:NADH-quinone oxidoreductase subunit N